MGRIRTVKPEFFASHELARVSIEARLLLIGLFLEADDDGRQIDSAKRIAGAVFPHDQGVTPAKVERWLCELETEGKIFRYQVDGGRFLVVVNWLKHQRISHPRASVLPPPPENFRRTSGNPPESFRPEVEVEVERERERELPKSSSSDLGTRGNVVALPGRDDDPAPRIEPGFGMSAS